MKSSFVLSAALVATLATAAFAQNDPNRAAADRAGGQQEDKSHEQRFIQMASSDNNYEIQLGQLVQQRAQEQSVKELAQRLVQDHQKAEEQLRQCAQQIGVTLSDQLNPVHQAMLREMQQKQGPELERAFTFDQVGDHHKDVLKFQWVAEHAQDPQVKQYAQQQVPVLREHLQMAERCAEQFVPEARTASETLRGERNAQEGTGIRTGTGAGTTGGRTESGAGTSGGTTGTQSR